MNYCINNFMLVRNTFLLLITLVLFGVPTYAQNALENEIVDDTYMVINKTDGSKEVYNTKEVDSITFVDKKKAASLTTKKKIVMGWGDSLTAGAGGNGVSYPSVLQSLLGKEYQVINVGVGGENITSISARQGGNPMTVTEDVIVPNDGEYADIKLVDYFGNEIKTLLQGGFNSTNPCLINGHECNIRWTGDWLGKNGVYQITTTDTCSFIMKKNTPIQTNYMRKYRNPYCLLIWIGQNGGFTDGDDLCDQIQRMIDYAGVEKYVIINLHTKFHIQYNSIINNRFGYHVVDLYNYMCTSALDDAGIDKSEQDILDIEKGNCPSSLMADNVHFNSLGYTLLAQKVFEKFKELNY